MKPLFIIIILYTFLLNPSEKDIYQAENKNLDPWLLYSHPRET